MRSDSLILITPEQLKITNSIFAEHQMYKALSEEYKKQIDYFEKSRILSDSIEHVQNIYIGDLVEENISSRYEISNLLDAYTTANRKNKLYKGLSIGGLSVGLTGILLFLLK